MTFALWVLWWTILRRQFAVLAVLAVAGLLVTTYYADNLIDQIGILFHKELGFVSGKVDGKLTFQGRWFGWVASRRAGSHELTRHLRLRGTSSQ